MNPQPSGLLRGNDLVLHRRFRASPEDVWRSITDPERTARWFGKWEGKAGVGNEIRIQMGFEAGSPWLTKTIEACEPPKRLVLSSIESTMTSRLTLALTSTAEGCELEFVHHDVDRGQMADFGPGWEYYLDCLVASREDQALPAFESYYPAQKAYFAGLVSGA